MRLTVVTALALAAFAAACGGGTAATDPTIRLTITVWADGKEADSRQWTLRCSPLGGTLPRRATACQRLATLGSPFRAVPKDVACTEIYGGPAEARVRGLYKGRTIEARFSRQNGCEIARWDRVKFLFPVGADT